MIRQIEKNKIIEAPPAIVWKFLTNKALMKQWMGEAEMNLEITTDWKIGHPILLTGFHHEKFENRGIVLQFKPFKTLKYSYISSVSKLPDQPKNYTFVEFQLDPLENKTFLALTLSNFPTQSIYKHVDFYWTGTLEILKKMIESIKP